VSEPGPHPPCNICGEGYDITLFDPIVVIPGEDATPTCVEFRDGALNGYVPAELCPLTTPLVGSLCGCSPIEINAPVESTKTVAPVSEPGPHPPCNICGEGYDITLFDPIVVIPGEDATPTCVEFRDGALNGYVPAELCPLTTPLVGSLCGCSPIEISTLQPTISPSSAPPMEIGEGSPVLLNENPPCNICGDGNVITILDAIVTIPSGEGTLTVTCEEFQIAALGGQVPANLCPLVPTLIGTPCGCSPT